MPNPELSQYHDHDTDTVYDYKDATARGDITELYKYQYKVLSVYVMNGGGFSSDRRRFIFDISTAISETYFSSDYDGGVIRCIFTPWPDALTYDPDAEINFDIRPFSQDPLIVPVYTNAKRDTVIKWGEVNNFVMDFVFRKTESSGYFIALSAVASVNAANVAYNNGTSGLIAGNVQDAIDEINVEKIGDNPTFSEAATRQNIASGETFAVILGKIKKFFSDLKAVAFSGSYNDLTDTPTIPDISTKMDKSNPTGSGKLSINRLLNSVEGAGSSTIGYDSTASGTAAVGSGYQTIASGDYSQANNYQTQANGDASTSHGWRTIADSDFQFVSGKYNVADNADTYAEIIGNGTGDDARSNARTLDWNGNETIAGDLYFNGGANSLSTQLSAKVFDNPTFSEAATRQNIASGETFAVILGKIKKFFSDLKAVAFSGSYNDLTDTPTLAPVATSGAYGDLSGTPNLAAVATSGDYNDLINKRPSDYSGDTTASAVSVPNSTSYTELLTVALTKGTWLINWAASFPSAGSSNTGYRAAGLTTSSTGDPYAYMMQQVPAVSNNTFTCLSGSCIYVATGSVTMRLKARQYQGTSGSALNVSPRLQAIRLL